MSSRLRAVLLFTVLGLLVGVAVGRRERPPAPRGVAPPTPPIGWPRELRLQAPGSAARILFARSGEGSPAMWMSNGTGRGTVQLGVHGNGFPFVLVSDASIRNFGLGRMDGRNASPILVFRSDDIVRLVFGLSMTEAGQPAFLVHYDGDGRKHERLGRYCDAPSRACTQ